MKCPFCAYPKSEVIDSRPNADGNSIKRRRECQECHKRFTTFEMIEFVQIVVIKKDGSKELFDKSKLLAGVLKATYKSNVNAEELVTSIEAELQNGLRHEISTREIGEMVLARLKDMDEVAYVRFASVYREFKDIDSFLGELRELKENHEDTVVEV